MLPLSCVNCCHNPLQIGPVGTSFGFCTRHRVVLNHPELTTCGQLLRKDLLAESAGREQETHVRSYPEDRVLSVTLPDRGATQALVEKPNGQLPPDAVVEEVQDYGRLDSKIASMAALHRVPGARAEVAMLSLSRGYLSRCMARGGRWTAGVHLLFWTLERLDKDPRLEATDLRGPITGSLTRTIELARWTVVTFRLAFVSDVGHAAEREADPVRRLSKLPGQALDEVSGVNPDRLLDWLRRHKPSWSGALRQTRYREVREGLHREESEARRQGPE